MKCSKNLIKTAAGLLLYNCDFPQNDFSTLTITADGKVSQSAVDAAIASGKLIFVHWSAPDALSANNTEGILATNTEGTEVVQMSEAGVAMTANLSAIEGTLQLAQIASGSHSGYIVMRDGSIIGKVSADNTTLEMVDVKVTTPNALPNSPFANNTDLPMVQININFGKISEVESWRVRRSNTATSIEDFPMYEVADLYKKSTTTAALTDMAGSVITTASDLTDATFVYSTNYSGTPTIASVVITFPNMTAGTSVTVFGNVSGYIVSNTLTF